jgi:hypothetical protein
MVNPQFRLYVGTGFAITSLSMRNDSRRGWPWSDPGFTAGIQTIEKLHPAGDAGSMDPYMAIGLLAGAQALGLLSAAGARRSAGSRAQTFFQRLFLTMFTVLGVATMGSVLVGPVCMLACGTSLAVMLLTATWDLSVAS